MKRIILSLSLIAVLCTAIVTVGYSDASVVKSEVVSYTVDADHGVNLHASVSHEYICPEVYVFKVTVEFAPLAFSRQLKEKESEGFSRQSRAPPKSVERT